MKKIPERSFNMKVVLIGRGSNIIRERFIGKGFGSDYMKTIGADFARKNTTIRGKNLNFQLWDLYIDSQFKVSRPVYFVGTLGLIIYFQKSDRNSFKAVLRLFEEFSDHTNLPLEAYPKECLVIVGITTDNNEVVTTEEGQSLAVELGMTYYEISIKSREKVAKIFTNMGEAYLDYVERQQTK